MLGDARRWKGEDCECTIPINGKQFNQVVGTSGKRQLPSDLSDAAISACVEFSVGMTGAIADDANLHETRECVARHGRGSSCGFDLPSVADAAPGSTKEKARD